MNSFLKTFLRSGIFFGFFMGFVYVYLYNLKLGIIYGIISGIIFGSFMGFFAKFQSKKFQMERPLFDNEKLIKEGPANHLVKMEAVGGWIYLTDKRLFYKSHEVNIQKHELSIPLSEIVAAIKGRTLGIIPNQLKLKLKDGRTEYFVVDNVNDWTKNIQNLS